jgi:ribosomal protein L40E
MADGNVDAKAGDEKTQKVLERQRSIERARALKKEDDIRSAAAAAKKKIEDDHRAKWGFYGMWCVRCRAEKQIEAKTCDKCKSDLIDPDTRQKQLLARVEEVKAERIARDIARDRWKRWKVR